MSRLASEKFKRVCDGVWHDRDAILTGRGSLSGEAVLMRAVYWRLCKAWGGLALSTSEVDRVQVAPNYQRLVCIMLSEHAGPHFDGSPFLDELVRQYREEAGQDGASRRELKVRSG